MIFRDLRLLVWCLQTWRVDKAFTCDVWRDLDRFLCFNTHCFTLAWSTSIGSEPRLASWFVSARYNPFPPLRDSNGDNAERKITQDNVDKLDALDQIVPRNMSERQKAWYRSQLGWTGEPQCPASSRLVACPREHAENKKDLRLCTQPDCFWAKNACWYLRSTSSVFIRWWNHKEGRIQLSPVPEGRRGELTLTVWVSRAGHVKHTNSLHLHYGLAWVCHQEIRGVTL